MAASMNGAENVPRLTSLAMDAFRSLGYSLTLHPPIRVEFPSSPPPQWKRAHRRWSRSRMVLPPRLLPSFATAAEFIIGPAEGRTRWRPPQDEEWSDCLAQDDASVYLF